jgi:hypothetical protein
LEKATTLDKKFNIVSWNEKINPDENGVLLILPKWNRDPTIFHNRFLEILERGGWITPVYLTGYQPPLPSHPLTESMKNESQITHSNNQYLLQDPDIFVNFANMLILEKNLHVTMTYEKFLVYLRDYFSFDEEDAIMKLLLNYEVIYDRKINLEALNSQNIEERELYLQYENNESFEIRNNFDEERLIIVPFLLAREPERHLLSKFYSGKGERYNRYFIFSRDMPVTCCSRIFSTICSTFGPGGPVYFLSSSSPPPPSPPSSSPPPPSPSSSSSSSLCNLYLHFRSNLPIPGHPWDKFFFFTS